jgi:hypothetical protein
MAVAPPFRGGYQRIEADVLPSVRILRSAERDAQIDGAAFLALEETVCLLQQEIRIEPAASAAAH